MVGSFMWYLLMAAVVFEGFLSWYFDVFVVTDKRVIDIDFNNLIYKNISSAEISRIQDVTYNVGGPLASFLDFGEVLVQTAGELQMIEIPNTPHPAKVAKLIDEMVLQDDSHRRV
jgi:membrane protein YdbS with pleckstrin-like domain